MPMIQKKRTELCFGCKTGAKIIWKQNGMSENECVEQIGSGCKTGVDATF
jgi:hypothetical protein